MHPETSGGRAGNPLIADGQPTGECTETAGRGQKRFLRILILEDNPLDAELEIATLEEGGYACQWERIETRDELADRISPPGASELPYDLIFADYNLPCFDGLDALRLVRERDLDVPFILISGTLGEELAIDSLKAGSTDYVLKSRPQRLLPIVARALAEREQRRRRRAAEERLQASEQRFRALIEQSSDGVSVLTPDGALLYMSPSASRMFGRSIGQNLGHSAFVLMHEEDVPAAMAAFRRVLEEPGESVTAEFRYYHEDGSWRWIEAVGRNLLAEPSVQGIVVNYRDVTDRKRADDDLRRTAAELARSNADLEQFAYVASHDLQEPLRTMANCTELLARRLDGRLDGESRELMDFVIDGARQMQARIEALLAYSRADSLSSPTLVDANAAVARALRVLNPTIEQNHAEILRDRLPRVYFDARQLEQVFQNLLHNAIKFRRPERVPRIHVGVLEAAATTFFVRDNGLGIAPQHHERIFRVFQRLQPESGSRGTGIGLAICKKIVERHGGRIWVSSQPDEGSTFYFSVPAVGSAGRESP